VFEEVELVHAAVCPEHIIVASRGLHSLIGFGSPGRVACGAASRFPRFGFVPPAPISDKREGAFRRGGGKSVARGAVLAYEFRQSWRRHTQIPGMC
jgi:hypothetical protein